MMRAGCIQGVQLWTLLTVSALGALIVNVPVLAASGVASETVTVGVESVSDASDRRLRVCAILLLPAAATVASAAAARAAVSMVMPAGSSVFDGGCRAAAAAAATAAVAMRPTLSRWRVMGSSRMAAAEGNSSTVDAGAGSSSVATAFAVGNTAATFSNDASNGMGLCGCFLMYASPPSASTAFVDLVIPVGGAGAYRKGCNEIYKPGLNP